MPNPFSTRRVSQLRATQAAVADHLTAAAATAPATIGIASPASFHPDSSTLSAVVWADLTGQDANLMTRAAAMAIPALARQRHLLAGSVARCPLVVLGRGERLPALEDTAAWDALYDRQPLWCQRTDGDTSPYHRMLWTVDDLMFYGWSLWEVTRGTDGAMLTGDRVSPDRWEFDPADRVLIDGELTTRDLVLIPGPHEGILNFGAPALRRTIANLDAAANAARNPSAYLELHYTGDAELTDPEIDRHIARWAAARRGENGGIAWTNKLLELREHGTHESHLLIEGRNADAVDVSRMVSSPASMTDATNAGASLTYETSEGRNGQFIDYGVGLYMDAIAARLSMDDVVPRGRRTRFDTTELRDVAPPATGTPTTD